MAKEMKSEREWQIERAARYMTYRLREAALDSVSADSAPPTEYLAELRAFPAEILDAAHASVMATFRRVIIEPLGLGHLPDEDMTK